MLIIIETNINTGNEFTLKWDRWMDCFMDYSEAVGPGLFVCAQGSYSTAENYLVYYGIIRRQDKHDYMLDREFDSIEAALAGVELALPQLFPSFPSWQAPQSLQSFAPTGGQKFILHELARPYPVGAIAVTPCRGHFFKLNACEPSPVRPNHWQGEIELLDFVPEGQPEILLAEYLSELRRPGFLDD
jgi:hypothetical protein